MGNVRLMVSAVVELCGIAGIIWGFALITPWLGLIVGGLALVLVGVAIDPPIRSRVAARGSVEGP